MKNKAKTINASWSYQQSENIGKFLHEESLTEEERVIERLTYTQKELDSMYARTLSDVISEELSHCISNEIDKELLNHVKIEYAKIITDPR